MKKTIWPGRRASMAFGTAVILVASSFALSGTSGATHPEVSLTGSNFEIDTDANLKLDDAAPSIDWATVGDTPKQDTASGSGDESFGQGTKEDTPAPTVVTGGIPPNKSDLKFFGVWQEGTTISGFLNLFWARVQDPSGTTNMDFEFNQKKCEYVAGVATEESDCSANGITPLRTAGDLLITYDLSRGGSLAELSLREWVGDGTTGVWGPEDDLTGSNKARGSINTSAIPAAEADGLGALSPRTFGEAQLALSAIFDPNVCKSFGSAYLKSRASDSFPAALKDFVPPQSINLTNCGSIVINKTDGTAALQGAVFTLYRNVAPLAGPRDTATDLVVDDPATVATDSWTCTSLADGSCTFLNVPFGNYWLVETTVPTGYNGAADTAASVTSGTPNFTVTITNARQPGTISIHKQDDLGGPLNGAVFTLYHNVVSLTAARDSLDIGVDSDSATTGIQATTCTTVGTGLDAGNCSFLSVPQGEYWVVETTTPTGYATAPEQRATITTGGQVIALTFNDPRLFKVIVLVCQESDNTLYASNVTFDNPPAPGTVTTSLGTSTSPTEAVLCGLGGATLPNVGTGAHSADISIPSTPLP